MNDDHSTFNSVFEPVYAKSKKTINNFLHCLLTTNAIPNPNEAFYRIRIVLCAAYYGLWLQETIAEKYCVKDA